MSVAPRAARILVVEDDDDVAHAVIAALRADGHRSVHADSVESARRLLDTHAPELVVLDVLLGDVDGFSWAQELRRLGVRTPVLFLTALDGPSDRVRGLNLGGDDYLVKPFAVAELRARVQALLRRAHPSTRLEVGPLALDLAAGRVFLDAVELAVTAREIRLLGYLVANQGIVLSRHQILERVWNDAGGVDTRAVDQAVSRLRAKLGGGPPTIETVVGSGYVLRAEVG